MAAWSKEQLDKLKELAAKELSPREIGILMDKTRNSVIGKCHRHKIPILPDDKDKKTKQSLITRLKPKGAPLVAYLDKKATPLPNHHTAKIQGLCEWIAGDPRKRSFCGKNTMQGTVWCPDHYRMVYAKSVRR